MSYSNYHQEIRKIQVASLLFILVGSLLLVGASPFFVPKALAATTGTISLSQEGNIWGNSTQVVTIVDNDLNYVAGGANTGPALTIGNTTSSYNLNTTQVLDGSWKAFVVNAMTLDNDGVTGINVSTGLSGVGATGGLNGILTGTDSDLYVNNNPDYHTLRNYGALNTANIASHSIVQVITYGAEATVGRGNTITLTYTDSTNADGSFVQVTKTYLYKETAGAIKSTSSAVSPAGKIFFTFEDADKNHDSTKVNVFRIQNKTESLKLSFTTTNATLNQQVKNKTLIINPEGHAGAEFVADSLVFTFTETGIDTGVFTVNGSGYSLLNGWEGTGPMINFSQVTCTVACTYGNLTQSLDGGNTVSKTYLKNDDTITLAFTTPEDAARDAAATCSYRGVAKCVNVSSYTWNVQIADGTLSIDDTSLSMTDNSKISITDIDANINTAAIDTINVTVSMNASDSAVATGYETGVNTSIFEFTIAATTAGNGTSEATIGTTSATTKTSTTYVNVGKKPTYTVTYSDLLGVSQNTAGGSLTFETTAATVSASSTSIDENTKTVTITVTEPDANDNSAAKDKILVNSTAGTTAQAAACRGIFLNGNLTSCHEHTGAGGAATKFGPHGAQKIGEFAISVINATTGYEYIRELNVISTETGVNTGVFNFDINVTAIKVADGTIGLGANDKIRVYYKDNFDAATVNTTITVGGTLATLVFDRSDIPLAPGKRANFTLTITDTDYNLNPYAIDTITTLRVRPLNGSGGVVGGHTFTSNNTCPAAMCFDDQARNGMMSWYNVTVSETGQNTGIFTIKFGIDFGGLCGTAGCDTGNRMNGSVPAMIRNYSNPTQYSYEMDRVQDMIGGKINFELKDGMSDTNITRARNGNGAAQNAAVKGVSESLSIVGHDSTITMSAGSGKLGDSVTITGTDADANLDVGVKDSMTIFIMATKGTAAPASTETAQMNISTTLTETGVNTGEFTKTVTLRPSLTPFDSNLAASQYLKFRYADNATSNSFYAGGGGGVSEGLDERYATGVFVLNSHTATVTTSLTDSSTGPNNVFTVTLTDPDLITTAVSSVTLNKISSAGTGDEETTYAAASGTINDGEYKFTITLKKQPTVTKNDGTLTVNASDTIYIYYADSKDASGAMQVIETTLTVSTATGSLTTDKESYNVGDLVKITVTDADRNTNSTTKQSLTAKVTTESWSVGTTVTLVETDYDTGIFTGQAELIPSSQGVPVSSEVTASIGDTVRITHTDTLGDAGTAVVLETTAKVGAKIAKTEQVPAGDVEIVDSAGNAVDAPSANSEIIIQSTVTNADTASHTFTFLVQVKNSDSEVIHLVWVRDLTLAADGTATPGVQWIPDSSGTFTAEVYVWESISTQVALSPVKSKTFTVS